MPKLETWLSFGSFGLAMMFVILMVSFYTFLIGPEGKGPRIYFDPFGLLTQIISISGVPKLNIGWNSLRFHQKGRITACCNYLTCDGSSINCRYDIP